MLVGSNVIANIVPKEIILPEIKNRGRTIKPMPFKMTVSEELFGRWGIPSLQNFRRLTTNDTVLSRRMLNYP